MKTSFFSQSYTPPTKTDLFEFNEGFDAFTTDFRTLYDSIKNEAGLIQGKRNRGSAQMLDKQDDEDEEPVPVQVGDTSKIIKMHGTVHSYIHRRFQKKREHRRGNGNSDNFRAQAERTLTAFCLLHGVAYLPRLWAPSKNDSILSENDQKRGLPPRTSKVEVVRGGRNGIVSHTGGQGSQSTQNQSDGKSVSKFKTSARAIQATTPGNMGGTGGGGGGGGKDGEDGGKKPPPRDSNIFAPTDTEQEESELEDTWKDEKDESRLSTITLASVKQKLTPTLAAAPSTASLQGSKSLASLWGQTKRLPSTSTLDFTSSATSLKRNPSKGLSLSSSESRVTFKNRSKLSSDHHAPVKPTFNLTLRPDWTDSMLEGDDIREGYRRENEQEEEVKKKKKRTLKDLSKRHLPPGLLKYSIEARKGWKQWKAQQMKLHGHSNEPGDSHADEEQHTPPIKSHIEVGDLEYAGEGNSPFGLDELGLNADGTFIKRKRRPKGFIQSLLTSSSSSTSSSENDEPKFNRMKVGLYLRKKFGRYEKARLISTVEDVEMGKMELDSEWLKWTDDETTATKRKKKNKDQSEKDETTTVDPVLDSFLTVYRPVAEAMKWVGMLPFQEKVRGNHCVQVLWEYRSTPLVTACVNALIFIMCTILVIAAMANIFAFREPYTLSEKIIKTEFVNHYIELWGIASISLFLAIWSITGILEMGPLYAEFMSRFNLAVVLTKYDVTPKLRSIIRRHFIFMGCLTVFLVGLFFGGRTATPVLREGCGFIGYALLRPFNALIRESIYYPLVEILGLLVVMYCFVCLNFIVLHLTVYAKAVENMAIRFNDRLSYRLGKFRSQPKKVGEQKVIPRVISYKKLLAEHAAVTSVSKHFGQVHGIVFMTYIVVICSVILLVFWAVSQLVVKEHYAGSVFQDDEDKEEDEGLSHEKLTHERLEFKDKEKTPAVPVRVREFQFESVGKAFVLLFMTIYVYIHFGESMNRASNTLSLAVEHVRRHGLTLARSSQEKRFILSLMTAFAPKNAIWGGVHGFHFNRQATIATFGFLILVGANIIQFSPDRLQKVEFQSCDGNGVCNLYRLPQVVLDKNWHSVKPTDPGSWLNRPTITPHPPTTIIPAVIHLVTEINGRSLCRSDGNLPFPNNLTTTCYTKWPSTPGITTSVKTPSVFKLLKGQASSKEINLWSKIVLRYSTPADCKKTPTNATDFGACLSSAHSCDTYPYNNPLPDFTPKNTVYDCFGNELSRKTEDDCGNLRISLPDPSTGEQLTPNTVVVESAVWPKIEKRALLCCFQYGVKNTASRYEADICNMPNPEIFNKMCKLELSQRPRLTGKRKENHNRLLRQIEHQRKQGRKEKFLKSAEAQIVKCICRLDGSDPSNSENTICEYRYLPPCFPDHFTGNEFDYSTNCLSDSSYPVLYKVDADQSISIPTINYAAIGSGCESGGREDRYNDNNLTYVSPLFPGVQLFLSDCSGEKISKIVHDDCQNLQVRTPHEETGEMLHPSLTITEVGVEETGGRRVITRDGSMSLMLCCFSYRGVAFHKNGQFYYCNAPQFELMGKDEWCADAVKKDYRSPTPRIGRLASALTKLGTLRRSQHKPSPVEDVELRKVWARCICSDLILPKLTAAEEDAAEAACMEHIHYPCFKEPLPNKPIHESYYICKNSEWRQDPNMIIYTPVLYPDTSESLQDPGGRFVDPADVSKKPFPCATNVSAHFTDVKPDQNQVDCFGHWFEKAKDECDNLRVPAWHNRKPQLTMVPERRMKDPAFLNSSIVHCCYDLAVPIGKAQTQVCNLPSPSAIANKCKRRKSGYKVTKEEERFTTKVELFESPSRLTGNLVKRLDPRDEKLNLEEYKVWWHCICGKRSTEAIAKCDFATAPPCVADGFHPQDESDYLAFCQSKWPSQNITGVTRPAIFQFIYDYNGFPRVSLYQRGAASGNTGTDCPEAETVLLTIENATDCFGDKVTQVDDCGNPRVAIPKGVNEKRSPTIELIAANQVPGMDVNDTRVFCCYNYNFDVNNQPSVCNMVDLKTFEIFCHEGSGKRGDRTLLKRKREHVDFFQGLDILEDVTEKKGWSRAICKKLGTRSVTTGTRLRREASMGIEENRSIALPECMSSCRPLPNSEYFTKCSASWFEFPSLTEVWLPNRYRFEYDVLNYVEVDPCKYPSTVEEVYDCGWNRNRPPPYDSVDDCGNLKMPIVNKPGEYEATLPLRIVPYPFSARGTNLTNLLCCYEYHGLKSQIQVCNMATSEASAKSCGDTGKQDPSQDSYVQGYLKLVQAFRNGTGPPPFEKKAIPCVCAHLADSGGHIPPDPKQCMQFDIRSML